MVGREQVQGTGPALSWAGLPTGHIRLQARNRPLSPHWLAWQGKLVSVFLVFLHQEMGLLLSLLLSSGPRTLWGWAGARYPTTSVAVTILSCQGGVSSCPAGPLHPT